LGWFGLLPGWAVAGDREGEFLDLAEQLAHLPGVVEQGLPGGFKNSASDIKVPLSMLPAGLELTGKIDTSGKGITANVFAQSLSFGS